MTLETLRLVSVPMINTTTTTREQPCKQHLPPPLYRIVLKLLLLVILLGRVLHRILRVRAQQQHPCSTTRTARQHPHHRSRHCSAPKRSRPCRYCRQRRRRRRRPTRQCGILDVGIPTPLSWPIPCPNQWRQQQWHHHHHHQLCHFCHSTRHDTAQHRRPVRVAY
jgi:hypothetical protein